MSESDVSNLVAQFERMGSRHRITSYVLGAGIAGVLLFAVIGFYMMTGKIQDQSDLDAKLKPYQEQLVELTKIIKQQNEDQQRYYAKLQDLQDDMTEIKQDNAALRASVNRQLPQKEQDPFFISRGFVPSYYQQDGGRLFGPDATIKLQTTIVDYEGCQKVSANQEKQLVEKSNLIESLESQKGNYIQSLELKGEEFKIVDTELKKTQKELRKEKIWKRIWMVVGTSAGLYAGYQVGHN